MTRVPYYPGCALKDRSAHLEISAMKASERLGFELDELESWTCCGAVPPPSEERIMNLVAPARILKGVHDSGDEILVTICDFCYNSLKRANYRIRNNDLDRKRVNAFLRDNEPQRDYLPSADPSDWQDYSGQLRVMHLLEYVRDVVGFDSVSENVSRKLTGIRFAPYYGCVMLRPEEEMQLDDMEDPSIIEDMITSLGGEALSYPYRTVCCGSYLSISFPDSSTRLCNTIIASAVEHGAEAIVVSCPLCFYNLDSRQAAIEERYPGAKSIPILYFTQLMALALGADPGEIGLEKHKVDPSPIVERVLQVSEGGDSQ